MTRSRTTLTEHLDDGQHPRSRQSTAISALDPSKAADRRLKARERQRRKRERDRQNNNRIGAATFRAGPIALLPDVVVAPPPPPPSVTETPIASASASTSTSTSTPSRSLRRANDDANMTEEEILRRDRIRESARLRQQKHRAIVKQRKLVELGIAMNPDGLGGLEEMHYALGPDGSYQPVLPPPPPPHQQPILQDHAHHQAAFPTGHTGGATFASTLLLSFSCSPLLKQHLLRTLHMTNEELASLEPVLAAAWDQWDHARRMHYAEQAIKVNQHQQQQNGTASGSGSSSSSTGGQAASTNGHIGQSTAPPPPFALPHPPPGIDPTSLGNDYRARFLRPLTAPSLFSSGGQDVTTVNGTGTSTEASGVNGVQPGVAGIHIPSSTNGETEEATLDSNSGDDGEGEADGECDVDGDVEIDLVEHKDDEDVDASI